MGGNPNSRVTSTKLEIIMIFEYETKDRKIAKEVMFLSKHTIEGRSQTNSKSGNIEVKNISSRYRSTLPLSLSGIIQHQKWSKDRSSWKNMKR
jgi:hypothetical protein